MGECAKRNCSYYWQDENDAYPRCHFEDWGLAPCEEEDWDEDDEGGFDSYFGYCDDGR